MKFEEIFIKISTVDAMENSDAFVKKNSLIKLPKIQDLPSLGVYGIFRK